LPDLSFENRAQGGQGHVDSGNRLLGVIIRAAQGVIWQSVASRSVPMSDPL